LVLVAVLGVGWLAAFPVEGLGAVGSVARGLTVGLLVGVGVVLSGLGRLLRRRWRVALGVVALLAGQVGRG
jgi:hypothetical protein